MQWPAIGLLLDLGTAAETVGDDHRGTRCGSHGRQEYSLPHSSGHLIVTALEAEVAGQPTAPGVGHGCPDPGRLHEREVGVEADHSVLMAVRLHERVATNLRWSPLRSVGGQQLGESEGEPLGCLLYTSPSP